MHSGLFDQPRAPLKTMKILLVGDHEYKARVRNFLAPQQPQLKTTIGIDYAIAQYENVKFQIWDTAGQERFRELSSCYMRGAHFVLLCVNTGEELERIYRPVANQEGPLFIVLTQKENTKANLSIRTSAKKLNLHTLSADRDFLEILASENPKEELRSLALEEEARTYIIENALVSNSWLSWLPQEVAKIVAEYDTEFLPKLVAKPQR